MFTTLKPNSQNTRPCTVALALRPSYPRSTRADPTTTPFSNPSFQPAPTRIERNDPFRLFTPGIRSNGLLLVRSHFNNDETIIETAYSRPLPKKLRVGLAIMPPATLVALISLVVVAFIDPSNPTNLKYPVLPLSKYVNQCHCSLPRPSSTGGWPILPRKVFHS